jgi:2-polyprenyl-3-methyl-5-hydroxy-6-metoxy-1,4-benzoquinol methylase
MKSEERKDFNKNSPQWDAKQFRVNLANDVAETISREISLSKDMAALDFGCGTGLLTLNLQPLVGTITGADSSPGMLAVLEEKIKDQGLTNIRTVLVDFEKGDRIVEKFNLIVCNMVLHHVPDTIALLRLSHEMLLPGGRLCLSDLDTEDGSFHGDNTGVFHFGFDREDLKKQLLSANFSAVRDVTATSVPREVTGKVICEFPVFLMVAHKNVTAS